MPAVARSPGLSASLVSRDQTGRESGHARLSVSPGSSVRKSHELNTLTRVADYKVMLVDPSPNDFWP